MEKRKFARTSLITDYKTEFHLGGQIYSDIPVSNIGTHGCCLRMPTGTAPYLKSKPLLENMILFHAGDRKYSLKGRVAWLADEKNPKAPWVTAGVEFLETPEDCSQDLADCVSIEAKKST